MISRRNDNRGYAGLIALLIVVAIIAFLMVKELQSYGVVPASANPSPTAAAKNGVTPDTLAPAPDGATPSEVTPIQRAKDIKSVVEQQSRDLQDLEK